MRIHGLQGRIAVVVLVVGVLAILINSAILSALIVPTQVRATGAEMARRAVALAACCPTQSPSSTLSLTVRAALAAEAGLSPRQDVIVLDRSGVPLAPSPYPALSAPMRRLIARRQALPRPGAWATIDNEVVSQAPVVRNGHVLGTLVLLEDIQAVRRVTSSIVAVVVVAGLISLLVAAVAGLYVARSVTRPILAVTGAARAIAAGRLDQRAPPTGPNETIELARAFNAMVEEVLRQRRLERDLLANVSHELGAPLAVMLAYAEALIDDVLQDEVRRASALRSIAYESRRLGSMVGDLVDSALLESGRTTLTLGRIEPGALLAALAEHLRPAAERAGVTLTMECQPDLPLLYTDQGRLEGVLVNLIVNAIEYTPAGGRIVLSGAHEPGPPASLAPTIRLTVRDTGNGIAPADLPRVFERFYRGDRGRDRRRRGPGGAGLGLAIGRQTVQTLGGTISAESPGLGLGSTFTIRLPVSPPEARGSPPRMRRSRFIRPSDRRMWAEISLLSGKDVPLAPPSTDPRLGDPPE